MNTRTLLALGALAALAPTAHAGTGLVSFADVADTFTGSPYSQVLDSPAVNGYGQVAFNGLVRTSNTLHLYLTPRTGSSLINISSNPSPFPNNPDVNDFGLTAFPGYPYSGASMGIRGVYAGSGGAVATVADATTPGYPNLTASTTNVSVNNSGAVVFIGYGVSAGGSQEVILAQPNGTFLSVAKFNNAQFAGFTSAAINNVGQVAFSSNDYRTGSNNGAFAYRYNVATGQTTEVARIFSNTVTSLNDAGTLAYEGADQSSMLPTGIYTNGSTGVTTISRAGQPLPGTNIILNNYVADPYGVPLNNRGQVAFLGNNSANTNQGIYLGDGTNTLTIVKIGDVLFGKTVTQLQLGNQGLNDNGQVAFRATFSDNTTALVLASTPEASPALVLTLGALGLSGLMLRARKTQKGSRT